MIQRAVLAAVSLLLGIGLVTGAAEAKVVKCDKEEMISDALDDGHKVITVKGTCIEDLLVTRDDLVLKGHPTGGTISGTVVFDGARRVRVEDLTVTGSGDGIKATNSTSITILNSVVSDNDDNGILVTNGAQAVIEGTTVEHNGFGVDVSTAGINVRDGASAEIRNNTAANNKGNGIFVGNEAFAEIFSNSITGNGRPDPICDGGLEIGRATARGGANTISDNNCVGLFVFNGGIYRTDSQGGVFETISVPFGSTDSAVSVGNMSFADLRQVDIGGTVDVGNKSLLRIRGDTGVARRSTLGNLFVDLDSGVELRFVTTGGDLVVGFQSFANLRDVDGGFTITCDGGEVLGNSGVCPP